MQDELMPQQPLLSLARVIGLWCFAAIVMIAWIVYTQMTISKLSDEQAKLNAEKQATDSYLAELEQKVSENKADALLEEKLETVKLLLANKKALHQQLTNVASTYTAGFSSAMTELSNLHHQDISLEQVKIIQNQMLFSGVAKQPDAVPLWLAGFEKSTFLSGQSFSHFSLSENEDKVTQFTVSSNTQLMQRGG